MANRFVADVAVFDGLPHGVIFDSETGLVALAPDDLIPEITATLNADPDNGYQWRHPDDYQGQT